jgi:hypothetical protein
LRVAEQQLLQRPTPVKLLQKIPGTKQEDIASTLHDCAAGCRHASHEERHTDGTLEADHRNFGRRPVLEDVQQRNYAGSRQIQILQLRSRLINGIAQTERLWLRAIRAGALTPAPEALQADDFVMHPPGWSRFDLARIGGGLAGSSNDSTDPNLLCLQPRHTRAAHGEAGGFQ